MKDIASIREEFYGYRDDSIQIVLLYEILETLKAMKKQEFDYWEAWKKAKTKEQQTEEADGST